MGIKRKRIVKVRLKSFVNSSQLSESVLGQKFHVILNQRTETNTPRYLYVWDVCTVTLE